MKELFKGIFTRRLMAIAVVTLAVAGCTGPGENEFEPIGKLKTLTASQIDHSRWSIGGETLDRDYADYHSYKSYLDSLGAKRIRLQGGWARCERKKGEYDFAWLDAIVDDAIKRGISPWLQLSYGNPIYEGGGQAALAGGIPTSEQALEAWDKWVVAIVDHFKDRVKEWEIWNEPDISKRFHARDFIPFYERTVGSVKRQQPDSRIIALGMASVQRAYYVDSLLNYLKGKGKLSYVDVVSYHGYSSRPENSYKSVEELQALVRKYNPEITLWQGENGAPSTAKGVAVGAMSREDWSETTQAKWDLRRMLGDMAYDVEVTNVFQISDMYYSPDDHLSGLNSKGLLKARPDLTIERPKLAYYAYRHAVTLFRGEVRKIDVGIENPRDTLWIHSFTRDKLKSPAIVLWFAGKKPQDIYPEEPISFTYRGERIKDPVLVDLLTGEVREVPDVHISETKEGYRYENIPATDSPRVICGKEWLSLLPE